MLLENYLYSSSTLSPGGSHQSSMPQACNFIKKETLAQVFPCEFCEISKNIFFYKTPLVAASNHPKMVGHIPKKLSKNKCVYIHTINHNKNTDKNER